MCPATPTLELVIDRDPAVLRRPRDVATPSLVFPLETTIVELEQGRRRTRLDRTGFAAIPARTRHRVHAISPAPRVVTLGVSAAARDAAQREYAPHVDPAGFDAVVGAVRVLPRTRWVDELVHRYVFERDVCERHGSLAVRFLETELVKELYFLGEEHRAGRTRAPVVGEGSALVERARAAVEATLFEPFSMPALAATCHASASTLLRAFRRELGITPGAYVRERRLDEALQLLESGRYGVAEVAARVGYATQAAFATAFQRKFHVPPSRVPRRAAVAPSLAPHGRLPRRPGRVGGGG
ncbi:MAG: helix-turn-helix transcriptional regulator [Kofleriaceae bacterium]|nr:helix-turn-helix transcriptional regulator [Kofleriaceae bacterium]